MMLGEPSKSASDVHPRGALFRGHILPRLGLSFELCVPPEARKRIFCSGRLHQEDLHTPLHSPDAYSSHGHASPVEDFAAAWTRASVVAHSNSPRRSVPKVRLDPDEIPGGGDHVNLGDLVTDGKRMSWATYLFSRRPRCCCRVI